SMAAPARPVAPDVPRSTAAAADAPGGASGCAPLRRNRSPPAAALSSAPMSMRGPGTRATSPPTGSFARSGGANCGSSSGDGNGKPGGADGCGLPAETSGLVAAGRNCSWPMPVKPGSVPRTVPAHSPGTMVAELCTQLLDPATLRPLDQGSRLVGAQTGGSTSEAACTRRMLGAAPAPVWK